MSARDYTTAASLPLRLARDPRYRDLVRQFAEQQCLTAWHGILRMIGEAA
ncbi:hypothetical protein [Pseudomonas aeruginosa]|jgi:hypothetical protein